VRARLASAVAEAETARREGEEKRVALEADLRERTAQLAAARAARAADEKAAGGATVVPASGEKASTSARTRRAPAETVQEPKKAPELVQPAKP